MSVEAITWALRQEAPSSTAKFILVALANCARAEDGMAWPSIAYLVEATQQDRKTVIANLGRLEQALLIRKGGTAGRTRQVNVYELALTAFENTEPKNGTGTKTGTVPIVPSNSTVFPPKESRFSASPVPKTGHGTVRNHKGTVIEPGEPSALPDPADAVPDSLPECPHQQILSLWAQVLPSLPQHNPRRWRGEKAKSLRCRWRETAAEKGWTTVDQGLIYFRKLFHYIAKSEFLMGRKEPTPGHQRMLATLEWTTTLSKWDRLHEGKYHADDANDEGGA